MKLIKNRYYASKDEPNKIFQLLRIVQQREEDVVLCMVRYGEPLETEDGIIEDVCPALEMEGEESPVPCIKNPELKGLPCAENDNCTVKCLDLETDELIEISKLRGMLAVKR